MSYYSMLAFRVNFLNGKIVDDADSKKRKAFESSDRFKEAMEKFNNV